MPSPLMVAGKQYKAQLDALSKDGTVDLRDVAALVSDAKEKPFTLTQAYYLQGWALANKDHFTPEAEARLSRFLEEEAPVLTVLHPMAPPVKNLGWEEQPPFADADANRLKYKSVNGHVVYEGFRVTDPVQGRLGDCWLLGSMAAVAHAQPALLDEMIRQEPDGSFIVTFQDRGPDYSAPPVPVEVRVTPDFPTGRFGHRLEYVSASDRKEMWPMILEKAYAKWKGGYEYIAGGLGTQALSALTGKKPEFFQMTKSTSADDVFARLAALQESGACMTASTHAFADAPGGLVPGHLYTLMGVTEQEGEKFVQLRNPWGTNGFGHEGKHDGVFTMKTDIVGARGH